MSGEEVQAHTLIAPTKCTPFSHVWRQQFLILILFVMLCYCHNYKNVRIGKNYDEVAIAISGLGAIVRFRLCRCGVLLL